MSKPKKEDKISEAKKYIQKASEIISNVSDEELEEIRVAGCFDDFISSIFDSKDFVEDVYSYLLDNKKRAEIIARIWYLIVNKYGYRTNNDKTITPHIISPYFAQWYDDGIMLTSGNASFQGQILLYQGGEIKFAVSARDGVKGEKFGPNDIKFISSDEIEKLRNYIKPKSYNSLEKAIKKLEKLLENKCEDESKYQSLLEENPWMLGATYNKIDRHTQFNDENIPDFTGVRVRDNHRDIIEIKQPFIPISKQNGKFRAEFHDSLDQTERYVDFATNESDYLRREKGLRFENPKGFLLVGYNIEENEIKKIRRKERSINNITVYTYNDLLTSAKATLKFFKELKNNEKNK